MEKLGKDEKTAWWIVRGILLLCVLLFTIFGFFVNTNEAEVLWSKVHPFTTGDLIGTILFYTGCFFLAGIPDILGLKLFNPRGSAMWNIIFGLGAVAGVVLIWNT